MYAISTARLNFVIWERPGQDGKQVQISDIEIAVVGDRRGHHMPLASRNINDAANGSERADFVQLAVIRLHRVEISTLFNEAEPGAIRFEIVRLGVRHGIRLLKSA